MTSSTHASHPPQGAHSTQGWELTPRDGLTLSDGRPFETGLAAPRSLPLPFPETLMGMICTQRGLNEQGRFELNKTEALKLYEEASLTGPLLCDEALQGAEALITPAPLDTLWVEREVQESTKAELLRLSPRESLLNGQPKQLSSLSEGVHLARPLGELGRGKPLSGPTYWRWSTLVAWLAGEAPSASPLVGRQVQEHSRYVNALPNSAKIHVTLERGQRTAKDGHLFVTPQVHYTLPKGSRATTQQLKLAFWLSLAGPRPLKPGVVHLGAERKPSLLQPSAQPLPELPQKVAQALAAQPEALKRVVRVTLLTPALFEQGAVPSWLLKNDQGADHELVSWVTARPQAISGWDAAVRGPKRHRRLAPAGSTYWIKLADGTDPVAWASEHFMRSVSDDAKERAKGFGLCVVGVA